VRIQKDYLPITPLGQRLSYSSAQLKYEVNDMPTEAGAARHATAA